MNKKVITVTDPIAYVAINAPYMTLSELQAETKLPPTQIQSICKKAGVKPITIRERNEEYIEKNIHKTTSEILAGLDMSVASLRIVLKGMGLKLPAPKNYDKPLSEFNPGAAKTPVISSKVASVRNKATAFREFVSKYGGGVTFDDLVYPKKRI